MKKFNLKIFKIATVVVILLTFVSWVGLDANGMQNGFDTFWGAVGKMWSVLRFPIFTLYWHFLFNHNNIILFSLAVFLNCAFYGFIIERFFSLRGKRSRLPSVPTRN
ncbi:MAG TPA: hypothetical protein VGI38_08985 [Puia sp.]|jgi:hypothetical protein